MNFVPNKNRYQGMKYNRVGKSGLKLPAISAGLWQHFGETDVDRSAALAEIGITEERIVKARKLNEIAIRRKQTLAQMAIAWG